MPTDPLRSLGIVLLVEDDPGDQELTRRALDLVASTIRLVVVSDGDEALEYLRGCADRSVADPRRLPDLVLLDLNMPRVGGLRVLERMRESSALRRVPVVVLTTSDNEDDVEKCYELGVNSFLTKPRGFDEFANVVRVLCQYWFGVVTLPPAA